MPPSVRYEQHLHVENHTLALVYDLVKKFRYLNLRGDLKCINLVDYI